jgi:hypothetical protein
MPGDQPDFEAIAITVAVSSRVASEADRNGFCRAYLIRENFCLRVALVVAVLRGDGFWERRFVRTWR